MGQPPIEPLGPPKANDPWRIVEWSAIPNECFIASCDNTEVDMRGPVFLRDGSMHKACPPHWEGIMSVLGYQAQMQVSRLEKYHQDQLRELTAELEEEAGPVSPEAYMRVVQQWDDERAAVERDLELRAEGCSFDCSEDHLHVAGSARGKHLKDLGI